MLANSGVMWASGAFALGRLLPTTRSAIASGAIELVIASCTYDRAVDWFEGSRSGLLGAVIWSTAGIVAGTIFGYAGHVASQIDRRPLSWALVAATMVGEGVHLTWFVGDPALVGRASSRWCSAPQSSCGVSPQRIAGRGLLRSPSQPASQPSLPAA